MLKSLSDNQKITLVIFLIIGASQATAYFLRSYAENFGINSFESIDQNNQLVIQAIREFKCENKVQVEILSLLQIIDNHKLHYKSMLTEFTKFRFGTTLLLQNLSVLSAMLAFLVASKGWQNSNKYLKAIFLTVSTLTASYAYNSYTFNQEATISENQENYLCFDNLEKTLLEISNDCQSLTFDSKLKTFYNNLRSCNGLYWEFKDSNIQKIEILESLKNRE